jgi:hypothetical protein
MGLLTLDVQVERFNGSRFRISEVLEFLMSSGSANREPLNLSIVNPGGAGS